MITVTDVVIIGGGVMGCSAGFHLARLKGPRVIVVEKGSISSGMTKRSGALIRTHFTNEAETRLALASLRFFQNWREIVGERCGFTQTGFTLVVGGPANANKLEKNVDMLRNIGVNTQTLSSDELRELQPTIRVDDVALAAHEPESGFVDPVAATQSLATRAKQLGAKFNTGTLVKKIRVDRGRVVGVDTITGAIDAATVVVMAGPWSESRMNARKLHISIGLQN